MQSNIGMYIGIAAPAVIVLLLLAAWYKRRSIAKKLGLKSAAKKPAAKPFIPEYTPSVLQSKIVS